MQPTAPPPGAPPAGPPPGYPPPGYPHGYPPPGYPGYPPPKKASLLWLWILLGVVAAVMVLGILAAVAIPSFVDYQRKAKRSSADLQLMQLQKSANRSYAENGGFPPGEAGPTPARPCCEFPGHKCEASSQEWLAEPWTSLDFETYGPSYYQFTYRGSADGQSFTATAIGDLDCDGVTVVHTLRGTAVGGRPEFVVEQPTNRD
jgi:type II secretory pathway pseudopilin PulG